MEVDVEVQRGTEAPDEGDRPGPGATGDGESGPLGALRILSVSTGKNFSASGYRCRADTIVSSLAACPRARAGAHPDVTVHHAGPTIADDGETLAGVMLVLEAPSLYAARAFIADSPFAKADVFADGDLRRFDWITGNPS